MADKRRFLDVWLVETNTVYREVPFAVVADWVQQSRLLPEDMLRPSGTAQWFRVGASPEFAPYIPRSEPYRVEDQAEALEPVETGFSWKRRKDDDDDDVDMIPLIDVSLVLLIFFMMISTVVAGGTMFNNPAAANALVGARDFWVGIKGDPNGDPLSYHMGRGDKEYKEYETRSWDEFAKSLNEVLGKAPQGVEVTIRGDEDLKFESEMKLLVELEKHRVKVTRKFIGVTDRSAP